MGEKPEEEQLAVPDEIKDFVGLLKDHEVKEKGAISIAKFISKTGSPEVFEKPDELAGFLARYPRVLAPVQRRRILEQWFAEKGVVVPEELLIKTGMHPKEAEKEERRREKEQKLNEEKVWTVDVDDKGIPKIRMIKDADEPGTTLEGATKAAKQIGKEYGGEEALLIYNETLGRHMPNFKSDFVKRNLAVAWAAAKQMDKAVTEGEVIDPMDTFLEQMAKIESMKELVGVNRKEPETKGTIGDIISAVKELRGMAEEKTELPEWMRDPVAFQKTIRELTPQSEGEGLKELRNEITKLREEQNEAEIKRRDEQINTLSSAIKGYRGEVETLKDKVEKSRQVAGKTAYDLLGDLVNKVPNREDVRQMVTEAVGKVPRLLPRGTKEREKVLEGMTTGIEEAAAVKAVEDDWFRFG